MGKGTWTLYSILTSIALLFPFPWQLYPEWPLAALRHVPTELVLSVTKALLAVKRTQPAVNNLRFQPYLSNINLSRNGAKDPRG